MTEEEKRQEKRDALKKVGCVGGWHEELTSACLQASVFTRLYTMATDSALAHPVPPTLGQLLSARERQHRKIHHRVATGAGAPATGADGDVDGNEVR